ncbi:hypothetical protein T459_15157 [Capsicum annuum]|uniref:Uncharacterized protein n=1 Tax=Capsicum annuum TaxID=4072 RepID=A0A2G2ZJH5_CAPAN|nr:hypothetical protein T459_15157 [Capsicum annuum]
MLSRANSQHSLSVFEELATKTVQLKTVKELLDSVQVGPLWIVAKIVNLKLKNNWSYLGYTKCQKSVDKVAKKYDTRYRVQIKVMDDTGVVSLLLWDNEAIILIGKSAFELKECPLEEPHFNVKEATDANKDSTYDNEMMSPKKIYTAKRGKPKNEGSVTEVNDDFDQLCSNKAKKVIKKEKNP